MNKNNAAHLPKNLESSSPNDSLKTLRSSRRKIHWSQIVPILTLVLVFITFSLMTEAFLTQRNLTNLSRQVSVNCILAFGMTAVILLGAIDLSIGSVLALGSVVAGLFQVNLGLNHEGVWGALLTFLGVIGVCGSLGAFTGGMVAKLKMPSFVVSLGILVIARGLALILSGGSKISPLSDSYRWIGTSFIPSGLSLALILGAAALMSAYWIYSRAPHLVVRLGILTLVTTALIWIFEGYQGIPTPVVITGMVFSVIYFLLHKTIYGRSVYAIGGNAEAARLCGIRVSAIYFATFVMLGILVGIASMIEGGRIDAGDPTAGNLYELDAIAAVVIGGTSLAGGIGSVSGTLLGAFLMGSVNNGMSLMNIPTNYQMVIKGVIIVFAVLMDVMSKRGVKA